MALTLCAAGRQILFALMLLLYLGSGKLSVSLPPLLSRCCRNYPAVSDFKKKTVTDNVSAQVGSVKRKKEAAAEQM